MKDALAGLQAAIREAAANGQPLRVRGGGSKDFYGAALAGSILDTRGHAGIEAYEPTELFVTARAGTPLAELEAVLEAQGQMLACEPPDFDGTTTIGGAVAAGLAGPRRWSAGAVRDFVLGTRVLDAQGVERRFGGQALKNVAGYDVSRLMAGSLGTLGVLTAVTLKTLPKPRAELSLRLSLSAAEAISNMADWAAQGLPLSATAWMDGVLSVRLSGSETAVAAACGCIGGERIAAAGPFWAAVRNQTLPWFAASQLWRLQVPPATPPLPLAGEVLMEWCGAQRWLRTDAAAGQVRAAARGVGGCATLFRASEAERRQHGVFDPLPPAMLALHQRVKRAFDPQGLLGPGRLYPEF